MAKYPQRIEARNLREKEGLSIKEIAEKIDACKSSVSRWCRDIELTPLQIKRLEKKEKDGRVRGRLKGARVQKESRLKKIEEFQRRAEREIKQLSKRELFLIGIALYWAEGDKKNRRLGLTSSDPKMILLFLKWLKKICKIPKNRLKCYVGINQAHKDRTKEVEDYWSKITDIPKTQFNKTSLKKVINKKKYRNFKRHYGTLTVRVLRGTDLQYHILGWIEAFKNQAG